MGSIAKFRKKQLGFLTAAVMATAAMPTAFAMPHLPEANAPVEDILQKNVKITEDSSTMKIELTDKKGAIYWKDFNIGSGETVNFLSANEVVNNS